jgi:hypothetical protein
LFASELIHGSAIFLAGTMLEFMGSLFLVEEPCRKYNQGEDYEVDETRLLTVQECSNLPRLRAAYGNAIAPSAR